jgi:hypothetical protein
LGKLRLARLITSSAIGNGGWPDLSV